jgi:putative membrane protein
MGAAKPSFSWARADQDTACQGDKAVSQFDTPLESHGSTSDHFAWMRTVMGLQRTLMAAVRTAISLIGFGFTVAQFFERLQLKTPEGARLLGPNGPRNFGLILIAAGILSMAIFTWQFDRTASYMRRPPYAGLAVGRPSEQYAASYIIAATVILIGVAAFASVFLRL